MEFYQVVNARKTVRDFKNIEVPLDVLERVLDAGLKAPTHDHLRNWEFVVLKEKEDKERALQFVVVSAKKQEEAAMPTFAPGSSQRKMYADAMPKQYSMLHESSYLVLPFFKAGPGMLHPSSVSALNPISSIWCCIENIFLAATAESLACSMRIPVGEEGPKVAKVVGAPEGYILPCYIGIGYPAEDAVVLEQNEYTAKQKMHFGTW